MEKLGKRRHQNPGTRGNDKGELHIKTKRAGKPKVKKVELFDRNYHKISKPLNYTDTIIAKAYCDEMEGETVLFTLWEDDAVGSGHNKINEMNKINPIPLRKDVVDGVAEVRFNMALYTQAARIADMQVAKGDKNEGKNHEYYVTVDYYDKMVGESKNVNIQNPNYDNPIQRALELQYPEKFPPKLKEPNKRPTPSPEKPKKDAFKAPITAKAKTKAPDPKGKILSVEFVDGNQKPFANMKFGTSVYAKVRTYGLKGKTVIIKIFEDDLGTNQRVYMENYTLPGDVSLIPIKLSQKMRADGDNLTEGNEQEYFLQIEYAGQSVTSSLVNVNDDAPRIKMETGASTVGVKKQESKKASTCLCQQYDLTWGKKLKCNERKKVLEVAKNLGVDPNWLMTVIALETIETFNPSIDNGIGYVGLIQFGENASSDLGVTQSQLKKMNFIEQMKYVEKYLLKNKSKYDSLTNLYLAVIYPTACGHGSDKDYIVLDGKAYENNPVFFKEKGEWEYATKINKKGKAIKYKKAINSDGKTYVWEIALTAQEVYTKGLSFKDNIYTCDNTESKKIEKTGDCLDTWDASTNTKIEKLHPKIRCATKNFINEVEKTMGIKLRVIQGLRTYAEQDILFAQGRTTKGKKVTNARGGQSNHNFGLAIDVVEVKNGNIDWNEQEIVLPKIAPIGKKWGFNWGGDWRSIKDKPHFEMMFGKSLTELRSLYEANGKDHTKIPL